MRKMLVCASALATLLAASPAWSYTSEDQAACTPDVFKLCGAFIPDEGRIITCLSQNKTNLSVACHKVFERPSISRAAPHAPVESENRQWNHHAPETTGSGSQWR